MAMEQDRQQTRTGESMTVGKPKQTGLKRA